MDAKTIETGLAYLEQDERLAVETNLSARNDALDFVAFAEEFVRLNGKAADLTTLKKRLAAFRQRLTVINAELFRRIRAEIREGRYLPYSLHFEFNQYTDYIPGKKGAAHVGPDALDVLLDGVLGLTGHLGGITPPHPDMIQYEPTPARVILDMADNAGPQPGDVFYDIGAGAGRAPILFHLVTGVKAIGVEIDSHLCSLARECASRLGLADVEFVAADAREVDYAGGTIFFMFTPFKGAIFQAVLDKLRRVSESRPIRVCTYGACTEWAAQLPWLRGAGADSPFELAIFHSAPKAVS